MHPDKIKELEFELSAEDADVLRMRAEEHNSDAWNMAQKHHGKIFQKMSENPGMIWPDADREIRDDERRETNRSS